MVIQLRFEYDEAKSRANVVKHGIDFSAAQDLWLDDDMLRIAARTEGEQRFIVIGRIADKHWSAIVTYRFGVIRLISVRRSRPAEVEAYESR